MPNTNEQPMRVRFAPSPTGHLHIGGARTALFNWLLAKQQGGTFILRIEDTDLQRSTDESATAILESMQWLGMDWDEGPQKPGPNAPYFQSQRLHTYIEHAERLLTTGHAYRCYCTAEEQEQRRKEAEAKVLDPKYGGHCRHLTPEQCQTFEAEGRTSVIRFRMPEGITLVRDSVRGTVEFQNELLDDFVLIKSDGMPTYNFAVVVDDALMTMTHVIRGDDHLSNTPRQVLLYEAFGYPVPEFAHIPMILGADKTRLSKRHGATSVLQYRDEGYLPQALVNYLALLGWSYDASSTLFTTDELIEKFSLKKVSKNPAVFDPKKLEWVNGQYIRQLGRDEFVNQVIPFLVGAGLIDASSAQERREWLSALLGLVQEKVKTLVQVIDHVAVFFANELHYEADAMSAAALTDIKRQFLNELATALDTLGDYSVGTIEVAYRALCEKLNLPFKETVQPVRVALTGRTVSPGLFDTIHLFGREVAAGRLRAFADQ